VCVGESEGAFMNDAALRAARFVEWRGLECGGRRRRRRRSRGGCIGGYALGRQPGVLAAECLAAVHTDRRSVMFSLLSLAPTDITPFRLIFQALGPRYQAYARA
jgi:hypothetical protein